MYLRGGYPGTSHRVRFNYNTVDHESRVFSNVKGYFCVIVLIFRSVSSPALFPPIFFVVVRATTSTSWLPSASTSTSSSEIVRPSLHASSSCLSHPPKAKNVLLSLHLTPHSRYPVNSAVF